MSESEGLRSTSAMVMTRVEPGRHAVPVSEPAEPEVAERATRRVFSAQYKLRILAEYERRDRDGKSALLRREGLPASDLLPTAPTESACASSTSSAGTAAAGAQRGRACRSTQRAAPGTLHRPDTRERVREPAG